MVKRLRFALGLVVIATFAAVGCGGENQQQKPAGEGTPAAAPSSPAQVDITFKSEPEPPKMGENIFEVMAMQAGKPVTDADVSVVLYMPAMPSMNMPEMRNTVALKHEADGRYRGTGNVSMAGGWDATVMVMRGGQEIGSRKFTITAK